MNFRIAKVSDYKRIAELHYKVRKKYKRGFFAKMGMPFLCQYYKIILNDPHELVLCAVAKDGAIHGFTSGTMNVEAQFKTLRRHSIKLIIASLPTILSNPKIIFDILERYRFSLGSSKEKYVTREGARG